MAILPVRVLSSDRPVSPANSDSKQPLLILLEDACNYF